MSANPAPLGVLLLMPRNNTSRVLLRVLISLHLKGACRAPQGAEKEIL